VDDRLRALLGRLARGTQGSFDPAWPEAVVLLGLAAEQDWVMAARHASTAVRAAAAAALAHRLDPPTPRLVGPLLSDPVSTVRLEVATSLSSRDEVPDRQIIHALLLDPNNDVRAAVARAAVRHPDCLEQVVAMLAVPSFTVRRAASLALAGLADEEVAAAVLDHLAVEPGVHTLKTLDMLAAQGALPPLPLPKPGPSSGQLLADCRAWGLVHLLAWLQRPDRQAGEGGPPPEWTHAGRLLSGPQQGLDPIGLDEEATQLAEDLTRATGRRSVALIGASGVGKTALVHATTAVLRSRGWTVARIAPTEMLGDHHYLGEWQRHMKRLLADVVRPARVVLYVPGVEGLCWMGRASDSKDSIGSMLRPYVDDGDVAILGESNPHGWRLGLLDHSQLLQLFTERSIAPADLVRTAAIAEAVVGGDDGRQTAQRAVQLSTIADPGSEQPGRTLRLIEDVLVEEGAVSSPGLMRAVRSRTGLPTALFDDDERLDLGELRRHLEARVMGQPDAIDAVVDTVALIKAGIADPDRPNAILLFVGPTGVGKTELARTLATWMFGSADRLLRFDMSEYASYQSYERLISHDPAGQGSLVRAVREQPFSVVLLDEIEKAHVNVFDLLLQVFDAGRLTDARGQTTDFRSTVLIATSNVGATRLGQSGDIGFVLGSGPRQGPAVRTHYERALAQAFRPEFIGRLDRTVVFDPLSVETATRIAHREVADVLAREGLMRRGVAVDVDQSVLSLCVNEGYSPAYGARPLRQVVVRRVLLPIARVLAQAGAPRGSVIRLRAEGDRVEAALVVEGRRPAPDAPRQTAPDVAGLHARLLDLQPGAERFLAEKSTLLLQSATPTFWEDRETALAVLDRIHRLDRVLSDLRRLERDLERTARNPNRHLQARYLSAHDLALRRLAPLLGGGSLADAFVVLTRVGPAEGLGGLAAVEGMYGAFAKRHGFDVEVVDAAVGEPSVTLLIGGSGAYSAMQGEAGLHRFTDGRGAGRRTEHVRVEVHEAPPGEPSESVTVLRTRTLKGVRAATGLQLRTEVTVVDQDAERHVILASPLTRDELLPLARLLVQAQRVGRPADEDDEIVRRYELGATPLVRDARSGSSTGRLGEVLDGRLELLTGQ
jgi:ATP-dependent Clp protease ATP-binding subunit ClpC